MFLFYEHCQIYIYLKESRYNNNYYCFLLSLWLMKWQYYSAFVLSADSKESTSNSLSRAEAVVITAVVCVVCSFTAGLLLGVLVTLCNVHYHKKQKRDQTERPPVYEDIPLEKKRTDIELQHNEAYGHFPR